MERGERDVLERHIAYQPHFEEILVDLQRLCVVDLRLVGNSVDRTLCLDGKFGAFESYPGQLELSWV